MAGPWSHNPFLRKRETGKLASTNITNELVDAIAGGATIPGGGQIVEWLRSRPVVAVKITGFDAGTTGGRYKGRVFDTDAKSTATGNVAEADFGTVATGDNAVVWNSAEIGSSGHAIPTGTVIGALLLAVTDDGKYTLMIWGGGSTRVDCDLNQTSGTQGNQTTPASWIYTVTLPDGRTFTDIPASFQRSNGRRTSGLVGSGYVDPDDPDNFILLYADEVPFTYACPPPP